MIYHVTFKVTEEWSILQKINYNRPGKAATEITANQYKPFKTFALVIKYMQSKQSHFHLMRISINPVKK